MAMIIIIIVNKNIRLTDSKKAKKSNILTGKATVEPMKNDPEVSNIPKSKKSYLVTNRFIEQKEKVLQQKNIDYATNNTKNYKQHL